MQDKFTIDIDRGVNIKYSKTYKHQILFDTTGILGHYPKKEIMEAVEDFFNMKYHSGIDNWNPASHPLLGPSSCEENKISGFRARVRKGTNARVIIDLAGLGIKKYNFEEIRDNLKEPSDLL